MKLNELTGEFFIQTTNEEDALLGKISNACFIEGLSEREAFVVENLVKKSLVRKIKINGNVMVVPN
jgi:hypothetical protein